MITCYSSGSDLSLYHWFEKKKYGHRKFLAKLADPKTIEIWASFESDDR